MRIYLFIYCILVFIILSKGTLVFNDGVVLDDDSQFTIRWVLSNDSIIFSVSTNTKGWIGIGWHCDGCEVGGMKNVDFIVGLYDSNGKLKIHDMFLPNNTRPPPVDDTKKGGQNNIISFEGKQDSESSFMVFERLLITGDNLTDHDINPKSLNLLWAYGNSNNFHKHTKAGNANLNLLNQSNKSKGDDDDDGDYVGVHGSLMFLAFGFLIPLGIFTSRYLKHHRWWFHLHIIIQSTAMAFVITGFVVIMVELEGFNMSTIHARVGITTLVILILTYIGGIVSHLMYNPNRTKTPLFPDQIHWYAGRIVYILSQASILLGMKLYGISNYVIIVYSILIFVLLCFPMFIELYTFKFLKNHYKHPTSTTNYENNKKDIELPNR